MTRVVATVCALFAPAVAMKCPGPPAWVHASCEVTVSFPMPCSSVRAEVKSRVAGENGWKDPHNGGTYSLLSDTDDLLEVSRTTANGQYTDKMDLTFTADGSGCSLEACSESQVTSVLDFSTNYCNLHDLWCGATDSCPVAKQDLAGYTEVLGSCRQHDKSKCVVEGEAARMPSQSIAAPASFLGSCPAVTTQPGFDLDSFVSKRWYAQQQMEVLYLPASRNYCVYAEYTKLQKPTLFGYTIQVHNYAQDRNGKAQDSGSFICARSGDASDPAKLEVGPCFLPPVGGLVTGPYWVLAYSEEEGYALVSGGQPTKQAEGGCRTGSGVNGAGLWIFTRAQQRDEALVQKVRGIASSKGFDLSVLNDINQTHCPSSAELVV